MILDTHRDVALARAVFHSPTRVIPFRNELHGALYTILMLAARPFSWIEASFTDDRFRARFSHRYGYLPQHAHAHSAPHILIYCHSIGELRTSLPFMRMAREMHPDWEFTYLFKAFEPFDTVAKLVPDITRAFFVPLDAPLFVNRVLERLRPDVLLIMENDFRYHLIMQAKRCGIAACLFGAEFSKRNQKRHTGQRFRSVLNHLDMVTVRDEAGLRLVLNAGAEPERVMLSGNLRFDAPLQPDNPTAGPFAHFLQHWQAMSKLFVMGSTYRVEEKALFTAIARVRDQYGVRGVVAPRRIHRAYKVFSAAIKRGFQPCLRSAITENTDPAAFDLLVLDTMGELRDVYRFADLAFVGGSMVPRGGHNIFEAAEHGVPLLFGEHVFTNRQISEVLLARNSAWIVHGADEIAERVTALLADDDERRAAGQRCRQAVESMGGASRACLEQLELLLEQRSKAGG